MPTAIASEATRLRDLGLTDEDLARATGAARSTARAWLTERSAPSGQRAERLIELVAIVERLEQVIRRDYIPIWLRKPVPALNEDKPLDVIGRGDYRAVARIVSGLEGTIAS
jgi:transcriptional regulator with XRE-family HTH domain